MSRILWCVYYGGLVSYWGFCLWWMATNEWVYSYALWVGFVLPPHLLLILVLVIQVVPKQDATQHKDPSDNRGGHLRTSPG